MSKENVKDLVIKTQHELQEYVEDLKKLNYEELKELEQKVIKEIDDVNADVAKKTFQLPSKGLKNVTKAICYLLNTQAVQWQYTKGLVDLYDFWNAKEAPKSVPYPVLDTTLRNLGTMQFKGYDEWKMVVDINSYFDSIRDEYVRATNSVFAASEKHNAIMNAMGLFETPQA